MRDTASTAAAVLVLGVSLWGSSASASDNCDAVLRPTNETSAVLHRLEVGYLQLLNEQTYIEAQSGVKARIDAPIVKELSNSFTLAWSAFVERRDAYLKQEQYSRDEFETRSFARTFVSDRAINAWVKCKAASDPLVIVARRPTATSFTARAHWNPPDGTPTRVTLRFNLDDGGSFEKEKTVTTATRVLDRNGTASVIVYRKAGERPRVRVDSQTGFEDEILVEATGLQLTDAGTLTTITDPAIRNGCRRFAEGQSIVVKTNAIPGTIGFVATRGDTAPGFFGEVSVGGDAVALSPALLRNGVLLISLGTTEATLAEFKGGPTTHPECAGTDLLIWDISVKIESSAKPATMR